MTNREYLDWLNGALRADPDYVEGMVFTPYPPGGHIDQASGYDWPRDGRDAIYRRVAQRVRGEYLTGGEKAPGQGVVFDPGSGSWISYRVDSVRTDEGLQCTVYLDDGTGRGIAPHSLHADGLSLSKRAEEHLVARAIEVARMANG